MDETERHEYMEAIRDKVCSRCVERLPGGPPCGPLGKTCAIELVLPQLVNAIQRVHSGHMEPYTEAFHAQVCSQCPYQSMGQCPCPVGYLLLLAVEAIEAVDERREAVLAAG